MKKRSVIHIVNFLAIFIWYMTLGCPFKWLTGIPCAGCGMTRAAIALLSWDIYAAWHYHPLVFVMPFVLLGYFCRGSIAKPIKIALAITIVALFIFVYFFRLFNGSEIVMINFSNGVIYSIFDKLLRRLQ